MSRPGHHRGEPPARLVHAQQLGDGVAQGLDAVVRAAQRDLRHRVAQHAGADRVALGVVGVEQALRRRPLDHLGQLPPQVHRVLHAGVEALSAHRGMHVRGVAGQQHPPFAVGRRLPGHVGEPRDPGGAVDPVVGPVDGDERLAEIAQGRLAVGPGVLLGHHDPYRPAIRVDHLAVADLVLHPADGVDAAARRGGCPTPAPRPSRPRRSGRSSSDPTRGSRCRPPCGSRLRPPSHPTRYSARSDSPSDSSTSTPVVVLREAGHLASAIDRHRQLADPVGEDALDVVLPQPEPVGVPGGEVADVQRDPANAATCATCPSARNRSATPR